MFLFNPIALRKAKIVYFNTTAHRKAKIVYFNPIALRKAKIVYDFGLSECNRINNSVQTVPKLHLSENMINKKEKV